ncbi:host attachment protein [Acidocella sp. KAb 2-4]|uniref:host attachment protein n=1 Tax=Acidocella sp. KAb 2-4 TaxID=2885158 RepID=UPI001D07F499|nr:host attachment protein [Acidocella sp. KAb 2-4]MCB5944013.1 host attachment protein [Acidocella sp. KAb 2-4]
MSKPKRFLVAIADGEHARIVRPDEHHVLHTERWIDSAAAHKQSSDLRSDRPGASFHSDSTAHHGITPRHDPQKLEAGRFAQQVAHELNGLQADPGFDVLIIAAPAHTVQAIQQELDTETQAKLAGTLHKDLVKTPDGELWPHLQEFLPAPHPPRLA